MSIHPSVGKDEIEESYRNYLLTSFHINDFEISKRFKKELSKPGVLSKGPYLEVTAPYKKGESLNELIQLGEISPLFLNLNQEELPINRQLYTHQVKAIRKALEGRNFVVATGTGSGKTESFLLPILNSLFREKEKGQLTPGVRAILIYPMNALVNDQIKRLRKLLVNTPYITFGRYTGETIESKEKAENEFRNLNPGEKILANELLSREEMRKNPPHILITNYAMLEYLLLRPDDTPLFDGIYSNNWRHMVLDEAHTYNGAKGIEVGMLLRRLKERVLKNRSYHGSFQCIATSATLGSGEEASKQVLRFASNIFDERFEFKSKFSNDLIVSERIDYKSHYRPKYHPSWSIYQKLDELTSGDVVDFDKINELLNYGITNEQLEKIKTFSHNSQRFCFEFLRYDYNLFYLRELLNGRPKLLTELVGSIHKRLLTDRKKIPKELQEDVIKLVELAVKAKAEDTEEPLLPARYHVFVRALEGAYVQFYPTLAVSLHNKNIDFETNSPVYEMGVCSGCGQVHLIGDEVDGKLTHRQEHKKQDGVHYNAYMIVDRNYSEIIPDEDEESPTKEKEDNKYYYELCPCCSKIWRIDRKKGNCCQESSINNIKPIQLLKEQMLIDKYSSCNKCGKKKHNPVRLFLTGQDGPASVLATALYQQLVKGSSIEKHPKNLGELEFSITDEDPFASFVQQNNIQSVKNNHDLKYEPQKLLIFSDSRQEAAYFAPFLERTYSNITWRKLIYDVIKCYKFTEDVGLFSLSEDVKKLAEKKGVYVNNIDELKKREIAQKQVMREFVRGEESISLEGSGLISFHLKMPDAIENQLDNFGKVLGFNGEEFVTMLEVLLDSLRFMNVTTHLERSDEKDELFQPVNRKTAVNKLQSSNNVLAWIPKRASNKRLDYLVKVYKEKGMNKEQATAKAFETLTNIWDFLIQRHLRELFEAHEGNLVLNHKSWRIKKNQKLFKCSDCKQLTVRNIANVCTRYQCKGKLERLDMEHTHNHYTRLYEETIPVPMKVKEHTAQLSPKTAAKYQREFIDNKVNVLSCSTTFEMGVDVGDLEAVFLKNVPPETANYIQRAGRAGRRKSSVAFVLTFAQRRSHDLAYYNKPEEIISGNVKPPIFKMDNPKIIQRHMHSTALSAFFKQNKTYFGSISEFFREESSAESGQKLLHSFLEKKPKALIESLTKIVPKEMHKELKLHNNEWCYDLMMFDNSLLYKIASKYYMDLKNLIELRHEFFEKNKKTDRISDVIRRIQTQSLIEYFSINNILPKYGFPVDTVEMQVIDDPGNIRLYRDLSMAITEYAPGSQVVANGYLYQSTGIKRIPGFEVPKIYYIDCKQCGYYEVVERVNPNYEEFTKYCSKCNALNEVSCMVIPTFGFIAKKGVKAGGRRPIRETRSRVFFSEYDYVDSNMKEEKEKEKELLANDVLISIKYSPFGKLAVINKGKGDQGYLLCTLCGTVKPRGQRKHKNTNNAECPGIFEKRTVHLGHEFMSDVLDLNFDGIQIHNDDKTYVWESVLYALLNGISSQLGVDRNDIDGCIYYTNNPTPSIILFDKVPGGAGYMREVFNHIEDIFKESVRLLSNCQCGIETSCYGCLKNYSNQYCHDFLSRGAALEFLSKLVKQPVSTP